MPPPAGWRTKWGLHTADTLRERAQGLGASAYLIKGLLPTRSISVLLGDSGLGKSPLMYQAAICIAAGVPFLGRPTTQGRVLLADFENGLSEMHELTEHITRHLRLPEPPGDLLFWSLNDCEEHFGQTNHGLENILLDVQPTPGNH